MDRQLIIGERCEGSQAVDISSALEIAVHTCNGLGYAQSLVPGGIAHARLSIYAAPPTADSQSSACPLLTHPLVTPLQHATT
jgi:hypothetical protein